MRKTSTRKMRRVVLRLGACVLCAVVGFACNVLLAQERDEAEEAARVLEETRRAAEAQRIADEENRQMRERADQAMREFLNDTPDARRPRDAGSDRRRRFAQFRDGVREFEAFTQLLGQGTDEGGISPLAKQLEEKTKPLLDFVKSVNKSHPRLDSDEFKDLTDSDLTQAALAIGTRIVPRLHDVIRNENRASLDIQYLVSLQELELDLLRLQWITRRLR